MCSCPASRCTTSARWPERKLRLLLDEEGFSEAALQTAWREQKNEDIAATIIGYIRQHALGSPLVSYADRVDRAVARIRKATKFTDPQVKWLERIAKQMKLETVVDRAALDAGQFKTDGGFTRLDKVFDGALESRQGGRGPRRDARDPASPSIASPGSFIHLQNEADPVFHDDFRQRKLRIFEVLS